MADLNSSDHQYPQKRWRDIDGSGTSGYAQAANGVVCAAWASGTLPSATPVAQSMTGAPLPFTATLKSSDAGRKIELSTDGGTEYFTPVYDVSSATMLVVSVASPVSHVRFTGAAAGSDTWTIR